MANAALKQSIFERIMNFLMLVLAFYSLFIFILYPTNAHADTTGEIANIPAWTSASNLLFGQAQSGDTVTRTTDANGNRFINIKTPIDYKSSSGRVFPIIAEKIAQIEANRMGKAVMLLARGTGGGLGVVGLLGVSFVTLLCSETNICQKSGTDDLEIPAETLPANDTIWDCSGFGDMTVSACLTNIQGCNQGQIVCDNPRMSSDNKQYLYDKKYTNGTPIGAIIMSRITAWVPKASRSPTAADFDTAESKITSPNWDQILIDKGAALPVTETPVLQPLVTTLSSEVATNRDQAGNVTGTTQTTKTLTLSDSATRARPGSVSGTETTSITNYNTSNQITSTTTVQQSAPPPDKPAPPVNVSFDGVEDVQLPTQEISAPLNTTSWGEGTCPAPIAVNTSLKSFTIPTDQYCDFATASRPFVLLIAGISALFIITGFNRGQS